MPDNEVFDRENIRPEDNLDIGNMEPEEENVTTVENTVPVILRNQDRESTNRAATKMINRSMWRNDYLDFQINSKVLIRADLDSNKSTRRRGLYEHLDTTIHIVIKILQINKVKLVSLINDYNIIEEIDIIKLLINSLLLILLFLLHLIFPSKNIKIIVR